MSELYKFKMTDESLSHHGIEGQKWGVKNGPPYPLDAGDHSEAEKRAMKKEARKESKAYNKANKEVSRVVRQIEELDRDFQKSQEYRDAVDAMVDVLIETDKKYGSWGVGNDNLTEADVRQIYKELITIEDQGPENWLTYYAKINPSSEYSKKFNELIEKDRQLASKMREEFGKGPDDYWPFYY